MGRRSRGSRIRGKYPVGAGSGLADRLAFRLARETEMAGSTFTVSDKGGMAR